MFIEKDGTIVANEIAPRVHNSGHWTQDGCDVCQFEMHIRAVCNWRLHQPKVLCTSAKMTNILTAEALQDAMQNMDMPGISLHLYDKEPPENGLRKVGHINEIVFR